MTFVLLALACLYVGRKVGWGLSRALLYTSSGPAAIFYCALWGVSVGLGVSCLIQWQHPGLALRCIMGYALGSYVAIPNFGLLGESTIPGHAQARHQLISTFPLPVYIATLIAVPRLLH